MYENSASATAQVTLGVAAELACHIVQGVVGKDLADNIQGSTLTRGVIYDAFITSAAGDIGRSV